ncbi:hypothetical protein [Mesorhizobium sp. J8]|uniref:hypothetical protein n=1 Tax=Mesorhizobium sp. J8 TaxID=2777475 RepID=UPI001916454D|nr:hypothetical protein [Mesorhizobium sp. J8]
MTLTSVALGQPRHADDPQNPMADGKNELTIVGGQIPAEECSPAKEHQGETH